MAECYPLPPDLRARLLDSITMDGDNTDVLQVAYLAGVTRGIQEGRDIVVEVLGS